MMTESYVADGLPSEVSEIRRRFFAMRNGIVADALRKAGDPHKMIFGLQLPQLREIAEAVGRDNHDLGLYLWKEDAESREARLLACHIIPPASLTEEEWENMADSVATREEADILAFRLLRYRKDTDKILEHCDSSARGETQYLAKALRRNLE